MLVSFLPLLCRAIGHLYLRGGDNVAVPPLVAPLSVKIPVAEEEGGI